MFNQITIVGVGLLGGSIARDLRLKGLVKHIVGVTRSEETATRALRDHVVDEVKPIDQAVVGSELIVMATPMQVMLPALHELAPHIGSDTILTDVGSVKTKLYEQIGQELPDLLAQFVLAHPIAGSESSGVSASRTGLFEGKHVIITATPEMPRVTAQRIQSFWQAIGAKTVLMSLQQHDEIFAKTSHLPHVVAFSLVNYLSQQTNREQLFELAAAGFYDFTRIASSDAEMWRDICVTNQAEVLNALDGYIGQLEEIREKIYKLDQAHILEYFGAAKIARDAGLVEKQTKTEH